MPSITVEILGDLYYKKNPLPGIPEYRDLRRDSQLMKPTVEIVGVELNIISNYPSGYEHIFGHSRA